MKRIHLSSLVATALLSPFAVPAGSLQAQTPTPAAAAAAAASPATATPSLPPLTSSQMSAAGVKSIVPSSADVFGALDELKNEGASAVNWKNTLAYANGDAFSKKTDYPDALGKALNLGVRVANAFVAIEAEDKEVLSQTSDNLVVLGRSLGVQENLVTAGQRISELARANQWDEVRVQVTDLQDEVEAQLQQADRQDEAVLVVVGGWLQGLHVVTKALNENYSPQGATILRQATLVKDISTKLENLSATAKGNAVVKAITARLPEIQKLTDVAQGESVSKENASQLLHVSSELVTTVTKG